MLNFSSIFGKSFRQNFTKISQIFRKKLHFLYLSPQDLCISAKFREKLIQILRQVRKFREILKKCAIFREKRCEGVKKGKNQDWRRDKDVELEKCCKMSHWLQKSALIEQRTRLFSVEFSEIQWTQD